MEYRLLGKTRLKVSVISFCNGFSSANPDQQKLTTESVKKAWDLGIDFFNTAEFYGLSEAEKQLGVAIKALDVPREDLVISTKIFLGAEFGHKVKVNQIGLSIKHIKEGVNNSQKRLQLDYADVDFCHRFDHETPLEEVDRTFTELIQEGYIHYWGTSEWSAAQIYEVREVCAKKNFIKPSVEQPQYNMLVRDRFETDFARLFDKQKMGATIWSPLAYGFLTGKYNDGNIPQGSRKASSNFQDFVDIAWDQFFGEGKREKTLQQMSWVIANKDVSTALTGCSRVEQQDESVKSVQLYKKITPEVEKSIYEILGNTPDQGINFKTFTPFPPRK
ncbi:hypothetical protein ABPG72_017352 [Tetrahymena utriculariae]